MNMCHNLVHEPAQVIERTCTYAHAHSRRDRATPIAHLVEIKHNVYMRALHSRDAYDYGCTARLDRNHRLDHMHMTYRSRDKSP